MTAEVIKFGEPENESERLAIQYLRGHLPDSYRIYTNLEIPRGKQLYEIDIILVAPHAIYIVDVKGVYGRVEVDDNDWYPENRQSYPSPLKKYRQHVRALAGLIQDVNPARRQNLQRILIEATVLLTTDDVEIIDVSRNGDQAKNIVFLGNSCISYFKDSYRIDSQYYETQVTSYLSVIDRAIRGRSHPSKRAKQFGSWEVIEKLGEKEEKYVEYLARKSTIGLNNKTARIRFYSVDPWLDNTEREQAYRLISRAFEAVDDLPAHDNILAVQDIFETGDADGLVLVTEDVKGKSLRQLIRIQDLTLEQKLNIMGDVLRALEHAHRHEVIHRNVTPDNIFITPEKQAKLTGFDYARIENKTSTIADFIKDELDKSNIYQDFDCQQNITNASIQSDLFSAGQVFYELLMWKPAFENLDQMVEQSGSFSVQPSQKNPGLPYGFDAWLQKLCAFDRNERFKDAREALDQLTPFSKIKLDLVNLPPGSYLNDQYTIIKRLGKPGSFAVSYQVKDSLSSDFHVMKIVVRDNYSLFERVKQEFDALYKIQKFPHPNVVKLIWSAGLYEYNNAPFLLFEYVEGQDLEEYLVSKELSLDEALKIVVQTALGLEHLHHHDVYHQDIKPSNLLITAQDVKIIDFNVAVTASDQSTITAGTRRYLPPDFKSSVDPSKAERIDRDLYALGITAYECITGHYPFNTAKPMVAQECLDPRHFDGCEDLTEALVQFLKQAIAPNRSARFESAQAFRQALDIIQNRRNLPFQSAPILSVTVPKLPEHVEPGLEDGSGDKEPLDVPQLPHHLKQQAELMPDVVSSITFPIVIPVAEIYSQKSTPLKLFDLLPIEQQIPPDPSKPFVLDPSKAYEPPPGYISIETEVEWMRSFNLRGSPYWVRGKALCDWAEAWLHCWNRRHLIAEVKQPPREKLVSLLQPVQVPSEWTEQQCLAVVTRLEKYNSTFCTSYLLADLTESDAQIWLDEPTVKNLAHWLVLQVPKEATILEQSWQANRQDSSLTPYYRTTDKLHLLKRWLGIVEPRLSELGIYPLDVPLHLQVEFDNFWERGLYRTNGSILDNLDLAKQSAARRVAAKAYEVLQKNPDYITTDREQQLKGYIDYAQYQDLTLRRRPQEPQPLFIEASAAEALAWTTESYLPLRRWETVLSSLPDEKRVCNKLAASFEDWILKHYPSLIVDTVSDSWLNYNVSYHAQELCSQGPVFWVVVDGLGWLDHQALLALLTKNQQLKLDQELSPRFSILPTKTEYAKWSLYSQRCPGHETWEDKAGKGFNFTNGKRYTDNDVTKQRLQKDLEEGKLKLYCWDTDRFDHLFHEEVDWQDLYTVKRMRELNAIAEDILRFVELHPNKDELQVVIASDHGQLMGISIKLVNIPEEIETKGRMAIGKAEHPQLAILDKDRFDLPHDISIIRGSDSFSSFSYADDKSIIGCHGGLYPEEVVIGFSILKRSVKRAPVIVKCFGAGRPGEANTLRVEIYNPNSLGLEDLKIFIHQLGIFNSGLLLEGTIKPKQTQSIEISVLNWPELPLSHNGKYLSLTGTLEFRYRNAEFASVGLDKDSVIEVSQIFNSGIEGLDDFL